MLAVLLGVLGAACVGAEVDDGTDGTVASAPPARIGASELPSEAPTQVAAVEYDGPVTIDEGGRYQGAWSSDDPDVAAVTIATTERVVIEDSLLIGRGDLVTEAVDGVDLEITDSRAMGLNPNEDGVPVGRFVKLERPRRLVIAHNEIIDTAGIGVLEFADDHDADETIRVVGNRVHDVDGRVSNGSGRPGAAGFHGEDQIALRQFVQLDKVRDVPGIEIAWNEVRNTPGHSRVEDNISIFLSRGTPDDPISIRDNFIDGGYPLEPATNEYDGGGIMLGDGETDDPEAAPAYVTATDNTVIDTSNYGIAISAGNNLEMTDNRVLTTGRLPDGTPIDSINVGIYVWNHHDRPRSFFDNIAVGNTVGWQNPALDRQSNFYFPEPNLDFEDDNEEYDGEITESTLDRAYREWADRADAAGVVIGPRDG